MNFSISSWKQHKDSNLAQPDKNEQNEPVSKQVLNKNNSIKNSRNKIKTDFRYETLKLYSGIITNYNNLNLTS